jgi:hypothetical protein
MRRRHLTGVALGAAALVFTSAAAGKEFKPGDLRLCSATRCVTIRDQPSLNMLASFIYTGRQPSVARAPRLGVPYLELRFKNGYVTGIVATARLDRFLSYGVYLERFRRGSWYAVPPRTAHALRAHAGSLAPRWLTRAAVSRSR